MTNNQVYNNQTIINNQKPINQTGLGIGYWNLGFIWSLGFGYWLLFFKNISIDGAAGTYQYGQFVNGDYWVIGPVTITSITPVTHITTAGERDVKGRLFPMGNAVNGTEINPRAGAVYLTPWNTWDGVTGYFSEIASEQIHYVPALNAALDISNHPVLANSSVVSTITGMTSGLDHVNTKTAAVLTVLASDAFDDLPNGIGPEDCFRPGYSDINKKLYHTGGLFNRAASILQSLKAPAGTPELATIVGWFKYPFILHQQDIYGQFIFPMDALTPDTAAYGSTFQRDVGIAALMLNLDANDIGDKTELIIGFVQAGIDLATAALDDSGVIHATDSHNNPISTEVNGKFLWFGNGTHTNGRRLPIFIAAILLDKPEFKRILEHSGDYLNSPRLDGNGDPIPGKFYGPDGSGYSCPPLATWSNGYFANAQGLPPDYFAMDTEQFYYVTPLVVALSQSGRYPAGSWNPDDRAPELVPYTEEDIGLPEWAGNQRKDPNVTNKSYDAPYRTLSSSSVAGNALAILMMNGKTLWNHNAFMDYADRWVGWNIGVDVQVGANRCHFDQFTKNMWDAYRANYGPIWPDKGVVMYGDISGDSALSAYDAALAARIAVGLDAYPTGDNLTKADVSGDGFVTAYDAALIAQKAVGLIDKFPVE